MHSPTDCFMKISLQDDMKFGKANGLDGLASEHFKYASEKLYVLLCICFNAMLLHSHVPTEFSNTILVPIIKDKKRQYY